MSTAYFKYIKLAFTVFVCLLAGFLGSFFTTSQISTWYATLQRPLISPPNWVFFPVWTILFILMGIAWYFVLSNRKASVLFISQLILNILWSFCFFYLQSPLLGFIEIIILWIFILLTITSFYKLSKIAAILLIPYILWVSFALILNFLFLKLNGM